MASGENPVRTAAKPCSDRTYFDTYRTYCIGFKTLIAFVLSLSTLKPIVPRKTSSKRHSKTSSQAPLYGVRGAVGAADTGARRVAPTFGKALFLTYSAKSTGQVAVESDAERLMAHMLTLDPRVKRFRPQPFTVDLIDQRISSDRDAIAHARARHKARTGPKFYTPDFAVDWHGEPRTAVEVKLEGFEGSDEYQTKLQLGQLILEAAGYRFARVVIPSDPKHALRINLPLMCQAAGRVDLWPDEDLAEAIQRRCGRTGIPLAMLCTAMNVSPDLVPVWLVSGIVSADLMTYPINGSMLLTAAQGDLSHLELMGAFAA